MKYVLTVVLGLALFVVFQVYSSFRPPPLSPSTAILHVGYTSASDPDDTAVFVFTNANPFSIEFHTCTFPIVPGKGNVLQEGVIAAHGVTNINLLMSRTNTAFFEISYREKRGNMVNRTKAILRRVESVIEGRPVYQGWERTVRSADFSIESRPKQP